MGISISYHQILPAVNEENDSHVFYKLKEEMVSDFQLRNDRISSNRGKRKSLDCEHRKIIK